MIVEKIVWNMFALFLPEAIYIYIYLSQNFAEAAPEVKKTTLSSDMLIVIVIGHDIVQRKRNWVILNTD